MSDADRILAEIEEFGREINRNRDTYTDGPKHYLHNGKKNEAAWPWVSDEEIAGRVRMLLRSDIMHEAILCAARDRILHLSQENDRLRKELYMRTRSMDELLKQTA